MSDEIGDFLEEFSEEQEKLAILLDEFIQQQVPMQLKLRYKLPFYFLNSWICYLNPIKNDGVELAFTRANEFRVDFPILDFKNRKQIAGIEIYNLSNIDFDELRAIFHEAINLDVRKRYESKRKG